MVFIIAITGCLYAFQDEIQDLTQSYRFVEPQSKAYLLPVELSGIAKKELPDKQLHAIKYNEPNRAAEAIFYHYEPTYYYIAYINPYDGSVLHIKNMESGFFSWVLDGHFYLWLPEEIGQTTVSVFTLIFLFMVISGIILWYPKNKNALQQRTRFIWKRSTQWKRKNFDLHALFGFYTSFIAIIFIVTGLVWGFSWWAFGYYTLMGGEKSLVYEDPYSSKTGILHLQNPLDIIYLKVKSETPNAKSIEIHPPETDSTSIAVNTNTKTGTYWKIDYRYFDQYTLKEQEVNHIYNRYEHATIADKIMRMNYDIHTGAIFGFAGKIFMFLVSLMIASLPITGTLLWWNRNKKN
ncbi:MAG: PepSY-associated TM helix domain-containing protein [Flavobacteriaceae bacterium]|nr:PepSY-associated TM helix domain-containing protein [Flavobacteriaceae bacterium]